jgi:hypothetical protein
MKGLDYYMDGLLHEYLNQPDEEGDEEVSVFLTDYYEEQE